MDYESKREIEMRETKLRQLVGILGQPSTVGDHAIAQAKALTETKQGIDYKTALTIIYHEVLEGKHIGQPAIPVPKPDPTNLHT